MFGNYAMYIFLTFPPFPPKVYGVFIGFEIRPCTSNIYVDFAHISTISPIVYVVLIGFEFKPCNLDIL
jgi:hypothetical protein